MRKKLLYLLRLAVLKREILGGGELMDFFEIAKRDAYEAAMKAGNRPVDVSAEKLDKIILVALERHFGGMSLDNPVASDPLAEHAIKKLEQVAEVCWKRYAKNSGWGVLANMIDRRTDELLSKMESNKLIKRKPRR